MRQLILILTTLVLCGCPPKMFGFYRKANPTVTVIGFGCVEDQVRSIPGVENLVYRTEEGGRPLTWSGIKPANTIHRYMFEYQGEALDFWLEEYWDGRISYNGVVATSDKKRAPALLELASPLFANIESGIRSCGFDNLDELAFGGSF